MNSPTHMSSQICSCTKRRRETKRRRCGLLVKSIDSFHCGLQVNKTQVEVIHEFSGKQIYKHYAMNIRVGGGGGGRGGHLKALCLREIQKVQGWLPHTVQNKMPSFPGNSNIINKFKKKSKNQQSGDDYTTLSTTTKITTGKLRPCVRWREVFFFFFVFFFFISWLLGHETLGGGVE